MLKSTIFTVGCVIKMLDLELICIRKLPKNKGDSVNFHSHNYHELVYYGFGDGETTIEDKKYHFTNNCFFLIPPNVVHNEIHNADGEVICLEFIANTHPPLSFNRDNSQKCYKILRDILHEVKNQKYGYKEMIALKLNELFIYIQRSERPSINEKNFEYVINYIQENYHDKIVLSDCAKQLNLSYDYFQHRFKEITGFSPRQFLINRRLSASKELLRHSQLSCTEIAYRCGFSTSAQYSALFNKAFGVSPSKYRKLNS
ncbi:MAG: helix-turn-helix domain-containing protein [Ruminococcaceae bacterium]|nr:helix-turn-helix domain-containing protein [Oscillospiraceae bacterium]